MSSDKIFLDAIEKKKQEILGSTTELNRAVERIAKGIVQDKREKRFFDDTYRLLYTEDVLSRRPFLNIGPGSFNHKYWRTADKHYEGQTWTESRRGVSQPNIDYTWDIYSKEKLQENDNFFKIIYSSHVIEHLFQEDAIHMLSEAKRVLEPGGVLRLVCPDADLFTRAYKNEDWLFYMYYISVQTNRNSKPLLNFSKEELKEISAQFLIDWVSLAVNPENTTTIPSGKCAQFIDKFSNIYDALDSACMMSSRNVNSRIGSHVNWFNFNKLKNILNNIGFVDVKMSGYKQSASPVLRDTVYFDRTDPNMSLYVEARSPV